MATGTIQQWGRFSAYDAANDTGARSFLVFPTNSRLELDQWTRARIQEKNRAIEANFAPAKRIKSKFGRAVVGRGIFPYPMTADPDWNAQAKPLFERWASNPYVYSIDGGRDFWEDQRLCAEELGAGDGEVFTAFAESETGLAMQSLDPFEIATPFGISFGPRVDPTIYQDGVRTNDYLRPLGYAVRELPAPFAAAMSVFAIREVPAEQMIHVFRRRRARQVRGLPPLYAGLNDAIDAMDTLALEKHTAKLHAMLGVKKIVKPQNEGTGIGNQLAKILDSDGNTIRLEEFQRAGAATAELAPGEDLELVTSTRPSQPVIDGVKFYCQLVALSADIPFSVAFSFAGLGGTPTRAELEDGQNSFDMMQDTIVCRHSQPIYVRRIGRAMLDRELPVCRDPNWWLCDWHGPAKLTVDYGRTAQANIDLVRAGMFSVPRYCDERGWNSDDEMDKQIAWLKRAMARCGEEGVDFNRFIEATPGSSPKPESSMPTDKTGEE